MLLPIILSFAALAHAFQQFCRCQCGESSVIEKIDQCKECTKEWCLSKNANLCGSESTDSIIISCLQNESWKEHIMISVFILAVVGLVGRKAVDSFRRR